MKTPTSSLSFWLTLFVGGASTAVAQAPQVSLESLEGHVSFLSSDELEGRGNGSEGLELAAEYIASQFDAIGLSPSGDAADGFFQRFRVVLGKRVGRHTRLTLRQGDDALALGYGTDYDLMTFSAPGELRAPLAFVGYGVTAPEHDYDDYEGIDVEGKVVVVLRYVPGHSRGRGPFEPDGWHATFVRKANNAVQHGAVGMILVNGPLHQRQDRLVPFGVDVGSERTTIPAVHMRRAYLDRLLALSGRGLRQVQMSIDEELEPRSFELDGASVELSVDISSSVVEVANVLGYLPPTDPSATEHIVLGAHYDHLGLGQLGSRERGASGRIHNGADDNASGVAGMIELARMFQEVEYRPRGILFAAFAGEELGLKGSYHYTGQATRRLTDAVAMINLDMIGRLRHGRLFVGGAQLAPELADALERFAREEGLSFTTRFSSEAASDHASFLRAGIPALFFFTGLHGDYHKPTDDVQFLNFEGMERVLRLSFSMSNYLLRMRERPLLTLRPGEMITRRAAQRAYFGVGVDASFRGDGVRFSYIADGGPAARAGLQPGDVLLEMNGRAVVSGARAGALVNERRPGEMIRVKIRRDDRILEVQIQLTPWP